MNTHCPCPGAASRSPQAGLAWCLGLASVTLGLCLGVWVCLWAAGDGSGKGNRFPAGQFAADLRSLVAAMRYLVEPDGGGALQGALAGNGIPGFGLQATSRPVAMSAFSFDRLGIPEHFTNQSARS